MASIRKRGNSYQITVSCGRDAQDRKSHEPSLIGRIYAQQKENPTFEKYSKKYLTEYAELYSTANRNISLYSG